LANDRPQTARVSRISSASIVISPTLAAAVNRLNLTTHVPRTGSNSGNLSFGKSGKSPVQLREISNCVSQTHFFPEDTRYQGPGLFSLISKSSARLAPYFQMQPPVPCRSLFNRRPPYETPSMNKLNKVMQAPHKKHNLIPTGTALSSSHPKGSQHSIPLQISIQACHRDIMPPT
jgi:hypothetical protein